MFKCSKMKKDEYLSPKLDITLFCLADVISTSATQGGSDGSGSGEDLDNSGWT